MKNDFENQNSEIFEEVVHNFGKSDSDNDCEIMLISTRRIHGFMIKKSWTVSSLNGVMGLNPAEFGWKFWIFWSFLTSKAVALNMGVMAELIRSCLSSILVGSHIKLGRAQVLIRGLFNIMLGISLAYLLRNKKKN